MFGNSLGNYSEASLNFENAMNVAAHPVIGEVDSTLAYYTGVTATMAADNDRAIKFYEYCQSINFEQKGEVPAALADALENGRLGVMDYYRMNNINADTEMRKTIAEVSPVNEKE